LVKNMDISTRLQEERKRLGLTQEAVAAQLGATKRSVINWEGGAALPGAEVLARYAAAGADVLYILTGQRSQPVPPAQELPRQEQEWLALYRNSSEEVRAALKAAGNELTKPARARGKAA
jgi:transcriptional regulator with XRE-family HTH domain